MARTRSGRIYEKDKQEAVRQWLEDWKKKDIGSGTEDDPLQIDIEEVQNPVADVEPLPIDDPEWDPYLDYMPGMEIEGYEQEEIEIAFYDGSPSIFVMVEAKIVRRHPVYVRAKNDTALSDALYHMFKSLGYRWPYMTM